MKTFGVLRALGVGAMILGGSALASPARVTAIEEMLTTLRTQPKTASRMGEEARLLHYLAEATRDGGQKAKYREEGLQLCEAALKVNPEEPAALLWWTAHRGSQATALNPVQAVQIAKEVETRLLELRKVNPGFDSSAADRVLAVVYQVAPAVISVGSKKKAKKHLEEALKRHPDHPGNLIASAKFLLEEGDCEQAKRLAEKALASESLDDPLDGAQWRAEAERLVPRATKACR
jgi:tetratricopeptide (TPR) repeat protein